MVVLVTGGAGFVPSNIVRRLAQSGYEVVSLDVTPPSATLLRYLGDLTKRVQFVQGDICDPTFLADVAQQHAIQDIVHAAVITAVNPAIEPMDPTRTVEVNVMGTVRMLDLARGLPDLRRFIYVSSSGVYGTTKDQDIAIDETYPVDLPTLYAISKYASEQVTRRYGELYGMETASIRIGAPYGPMDHQTWARHERNVICDIIDHALRGEPIVATQAGLDFARDWTFIDDAARGIEAALFAPRLRYDVYNLSSGVSQTIQEIIDATAAYVPGTTVEVTDDPAAVNINLISGKPRGPLRVQRMADDVGFTASVDLPEGVRRFVEWWREYEIGAEASTSTVA
jgi:nucleoside-diphosphate-sugar epimerase